MENNAQDQSQNKNASLGLPMKLNKKFELENCVTKDLREDQKDVAAVATCKLQEWLTCVQSENTTDCAPLHCDQCSCHSDDTFLRHRFVSHLNNHTRASGSKGKKQFTAFLEHPQNRAASFWRQAKIVCRNRETPNSVVLMSHLSPTQQLFNTLCIIHAPPLHPVLNALLHPCSAVAPSCVPDSHPPTHRICTLVPDLHPPMHRICPRVCPPMHPRCTLPRTLAAPSCAPSLCTCTLQCHSVFTGHARRRLTGFCVWASSRTTTKQNYL